MNNSRQDYVLCFMSLITCINELDGMMALVPFLCSKCLGCVYVQRESKSSDFKGVSGMFSLQIYMDHSSIYVFVKKKF